MVYSNQSFGYWLRLQRKANDLTREGLARLVFCSAETIRKIENEERRPSAQIADRLAEIFHIPLSERETFLRYARGNSVKQPELPGQITPWTQEGQIPKEHIPISTTKFIGREKELIDIQGYLSDPQIRLINLLGPPGIGKTRLSLEIGHLCRSDFNNGVFFVALDVVEKADLITTTILSALGYTGKTMGQSNQFLADMIYQKQMLLILDNCEHLIEVIADLVTVLLRECEHLKIICTSREALRIAGEWQYKLRPLDVPEELSSIDLNHLSSYPAIALFSVRAKSALADFSLQIHNANEIFTICKKLDGLPLAIELIAPRIRFMSPKTLLEQITKQPVLFSNGMRGLPPRQKTLFNAIQWSYQLLSASEQKLFRFMSVFSGGFTLDIIVAALEEVFSGISIPEIVSSLLDKSLIQNTVDVYDTNRFFMLTTIRQFSYDQLCRLNEDHSARMLHLHFFRQLAENGEKELRGAEQISWINRLESELDNFRSAIAWAISQNDIESTLRLLGSLGWLWEIRGHYQEARNWFYQIRTHPNTLQYPRLYAKLLNHIGRYCWLQENACNAEELLNESKELSVASGKEGKLNLVDSLNWLAIINILQNNELKKAKDQLLQAFSILQNNEDEGAYAMTTFHNGILELSQRNIEQALNNLKKSYSLFKNHGDFFFQSRTCIFLGYQALYADQFELAYRYFSENLEIDEALLFWDGIADGWLNFGNYYRKQELFSQAFDCFEKSISICEAHGLIKRDSYYNSGMTALHLHQFQIAEKHFKRVLFLDIKKGDLFSLKLPLMGLAGTKDGLGQLDSAATLMGITKLLMESVSGEIPDVEQLEYDIHFKNTSEKLGESKFGELLNRGYLLSIQQAGEFAMNA